jgi:hypothetical protein
MKKYSAIELVVEGSKQGTCVPLPVLILNVEP